MVPFFPTPYPDETFHSLISRYHMYSGNQAYEHTLYDLFGENLKCMNWELPPKIRVFKKNTNFGLSNEEILSLYTLYPYYSAFKSNERRDAIKQSFINDLGINHLQRSGLVESRKKTYRLLRHCKYCLDDDIEKYGESYWHRVHQIPGVFVCPIHKCALLESPLQLSVYGYSNKHFQLATKDLFTDSIPIVYEKTLLDKLYAYAFSAQWLLSISNVIRTSQLNGTYRYLFKANGYTKNGRIDHKRWEESFLRYYGKEFLEKYGCLPNGKYPWLKNFFKTTDPSKHILVILLLCKSMKNFLNLFSIDATTKSSIHFNKDEDATREIINNSPFGEGPWPCLNPTHIDSYKKDVIKDVRIYKCTSTKKLVGIFRCSCGFSYSRKGKEGQVLDRFKISKKITFGPVWESRLKYLIEQRKTLKSIARELQVGSLTVKRYATILGIPFSWEGEQLEAARKSGKYTDKMKKRKWSREKEELKRKQWIEVTQQQDFTVTKHRALYLWLWNNDRQWLKSNSPRRKNYKKNINWDQRDKELFIEVKHIIDNWFTLEKHRKKRITKSAIGAQVKLTTYYRHLNCKKTPCTYNYVQSVIETIDEFQIRRIKWAYEELISYKVKLTSRGLRRKAGIGSDSKMSPRVRRFINELLFS